MKEKLTLQDLIDLLAKKAGLTKKEADAFFREFFSVISDNIFNNEPVKIKDFGTFKLTKVSSRESVDVNTGEKIEIPTHYKLSFIPDKTLKALVNKPFEQFETTLLEDSVSFDSIEESEEPVGSPEDEDTSIDEAYFAKPIEKIASKKTEVEVKREMEDITSRIDNLDISPKAAAEDTVIKEPEEKPLPEEEEKELPVNTPFVYTYTADEEMEESDAVITMVVPATRGVAEKPETPSVSEEIKNLSLSVEEIEREIVESENFEIEEETGEEIPLNINKVQEKIDQLKEAIDALGKVTWQSDSPEDSLSAKPTVDEADIYNEELYARKNLTGVLPELEPEELEASGQEDFTAEAVSTEEEAVGSDQAGEEEMYGDAMPETVREKRDEDLLSTLFDSNKAEDKAVTDKPVEVDNTERIEDKELEKELEDDDDMDYYGYTQDSSWAKFRKRIPIILFLLVVIALGVYHFAKLFEQKVDYHNYNPYRNLSGVDTIPNVVSDDEAALPLFEDSIEYIHPDNAPEELSLEEEEIPAQPLEVETESSAVSDDAINPEEEEGSIGKKISDNLNIRVLRKAAYVKENMPLSVTRQQPEIGNVTAAAPSPSVTPAQQTNAPESKYPLEEAVISGASLRSMAKRHYGSNIFWVYIFEENKNKLKNFDELSVGQVLTVPDLKKYNTGINDPKSVEKAKELERKIFSSAQKGN